VWKREGYEPLRRPILRRESSIKTNLRNVGWGDMNCIDLAEDRDRGGLL
jgi:hypothetical protein